VRYHLVRYSMYRRLRQCFPQGISGKVLAISGIGNFAPFLAEPAEVTETSYPEVDMMDLPYAEGEFDFVISDQVLEHLEDPWQAVRESHRVLVEGGIAVHTSCLINYIHPSPLDLWRFTPDGMRWLCRDFSDVIECGGWGNRLVILLAFLNWRFMYMTVPENPRGLRRALATFNEPRFPISTWVVARK